MRAICIALILALGGCAAPAPGEIPEGHVALPISGRVVPEARACAIALAFRISVQTGTTALSGPALRQALAPWGNIINAAYCQSAQAEAAESVE